MNSKWTGLVVVMGVCLVGGCGMGDQPSAEVPSSPAQSAEVTPDVDVTVVPDDPSAFVGCWHDIPGVPAGYGNRYFFRADGTFWWAANQMFVDETTPSPVSASGGTWAYADGKMTLTTTDEHRTVGGTVVDAPGGTEIEGGKLQHFSVNSTKVLDVTLPKVVDDPENPIGLPSILLDGTEFWAFSHQWKCDSPDEMNVEDFLGGPDMADFYG
ncbi:MAG: hypothetical protein FWD11_03505 [Micrococcales bacterium]|nr:hypothetical protein [Micrococcales bacterium]